MKKKRELSRRGREFPPQSLYQESGAAMAELVFVVLVLLVAGLALGQLVLRGFQDDSAKDMARLGVRAVSASYTSRGDMGVMRFVNGTLSVADVRPAIEVLGRIFNTSTENASPQPMPLFRLYELPRDICTPGSLPIPPLSDCVTVQRGGNLVNHANPADCNPMDTAAASYALSHGTCYKTPYMLCLMAVTESGTEIETVCFPPRIEGEATILATAAPTAAPTGVIPGGTVIPSETADPGEPTPSPTAPISEPPPPTPTPTPTPTPSPTPPIGDGDGSPTPTPSPTSSGPKTGGSVTGGADGEPIGGETTTGDSDVSYLEDLDGEGRF